MFYSFYFDAPQNGFPACGYELCSGFITLPSVQAGKGPEMLYKLLLCCLGDDRVPLSAQCGLESAEPSVWSGSHCPPCTQASFWSLESRREMDLELGRHYQCADGREKAQSHRHIWQVSCPPRGCLRRASWRKRCSSWHFPEKQELGRKMA